MQLLQTIPDPEPGMAMISRLRVEARAGSMDAAREVIHMLLEHAQMAGYLEGIVPQSSRTSDDHYGYVQQFDGWHELGLPYEGRVVCKFDHERARGGLPQVGYEVKKIETEADVLSPWDCGHGYVVLPRRFPVTRENAWDDVQRAGMPTETADEVVADIRSIAGVTRVIATLEDNEATVEVTFDGTRIARHGETLREAALAARKQTVSLVASRTGEG